MGSVKGIFWGASAVLAAAALLELVELWQPSPPEITARSLMAARSELLRRRQPAQAVVLSPLLPPELTPSLVELGASVEIPPARRAPVLWVVDVQDEPLRLEGLEAERVVLPGPLVLRKVERPGAHGPPTPFDLVRDLSSGMMRVESAPGRVVATCDVPRPGGGFSCPGVPGWVHAARVRQTVNGEGRDCVWAHPISGRLLVVELPAMAVPEGKALELTYGAALSDSAVRQAPNGAAIEHAIRQGGRTRSRLRVPNQPGWFERTVRLEPDLPIQWSISTREDGARHQCIDARMRFVAADPEPGPNSDRKTDSQEPETRE